jgi:hypothetical protein
VKRRDALRLLAASTTATAAGSMIVSAPAFADSGSSACRYDFNGTPTVSIRVVNRVLFGVVPADFISATFMGGMDGNCPCNGAPTIEYSYAFAAASGPSGDAGGWVTTPSVSSPAIFLNLFDNGGDTVEVSVGVRVTCPDTPQPAIVCRFTTGTIGVGAANTPAGDVTSSFTLPPGSGNSSAPGLPACDPLLFSTQALRGVPTVQLVAGAGRPLTDDDVPADLQTAPDPLAAPTEPVAAPETTTTTTPTPTNPTTTTSPSTPSTTTPSPSSTTTTTPPSGSTSTSTPPPD